MNATQNEVVNKAALDGITLILNAAEGTLHIIALRDGQRLFAQEWNTPTRGTEIMAPAIVEAFGHMRIAIADIKRIACVNGPGGFTGVRLALATAAGLARGTGAQLAGLDYMQALASSVLAAEGDILWVLTHARRNLVHAQGFSISALGHVPVPFCPAEAISLEQALERIMLHDKPAFVCGSGLTRNRAFFEEHLENTVLLPDEHSQPTLDALIRLTAVATWQNEDIEAFYLRPCDAEENLAYIATKQGMDAQHAKDELARLTATGI